jgi:hypothetical protein
VSKLHRVGDIDIAQDLDFQRREWVFQRIGWVILFLIALFALLGGCGRGLLARATTQTPDRALVLRYDRLARHQAPSKLELRLQAAAGDTVSVWLNQPFVDGVKVEQILPEPESVVSGDGRITWRFVVAANPEITFLISPDKFFRRQGELGLNEGPSLRFSQFVFP